VRGGCAARDLAGGAVLDAASTGCGAEKFSPSAHGRSAECTSCSSSPSQGSHPGISHPEGFHATSSRLAAARMPMGSAISAGAGTLTVACHGRFPRHGSPRLWNVTGIGVTLRKVTRPLETGVPSAECSPAKERGADAHRHPNRRFVRGQTRSVAVARQAAAG
jgi:hypothetical protein